MVQVSSIMVTVAIRRGTINRFTIGGDGSTVAVRVVHVVLVQVAQSAESATRAVQQKMRMAMAKQQK